MQYLLAILLPPLAMAMAGKVVQAVLCLVLMITLIGWPIASIWALFVVAGHAADKRTDRLVKAMNAQQPR